MMLASRHGPSIRAGLIRKVVLSINTPLRPHLSTDSANFDSQAWNSGAVISAVVSNQRTSITSIDGRSKISPHRSSYTCSIIGFLLLRWVGRDSQPRARLRKGLESPADQLGPAIRELRYHLRVDGADGAKGNLEVRPLAAIAQLEGSDAERNAQVEGPGQLQVGVVGPAWDRGQHRAAVLPGLDEEAPEAPLQGDARRVRAKEGMSAPTARIRGQSCEDGAPRRGDRHVEGHVDDWQIRAHLLCPRFHLPPKPKQARRPARSLSVDPALVHPLQRHRVEVVPALTASLAARDEARAAPDLEVAHDLDPRDFELGGDFAGDPRPLAHQVED